MATIRLDQKTYDNFSGGYTCEQAYFTEKIVSFIGDSKNIDIYASSNNNGYGFKKMLGNTLFQTIEGEKIVGLFKYEYAKDKTYLIIHTVNDTEGKIYYLDNNSNVKLLKRGLDKNAKNGSFINFSQTLPDRRYLGIFGNGVDPFVKIELGANPEIEIIDERDSEDRQVRSNILEVFYGRVFCGNEDRIHWSKSLDPFNWNAEDDAGWVQLDGDIVAITTYSGGLIISTKKSTYYLAKDQTSNGFTTTVLSPNHAISSRGILKHDNYALYIAEDGIYPVNVTQENTKKVDEDISWCIQNWIAKRDLTKNDNIFSLSITVQGRNEVWFHIPINGDNEHSYLFVYRFITGRQSHYYWLPPRVQPKINCLIEFNGMILSGNDNGEILQELKGNTFNGSPISAIAEFPELDFNGTHNKQKFKLFAYVEAQETNNFYLDYFFDGDLNPDRQEVISGDDPSMLVWDNDDWDSEESLWAWEVLMECMLDKPRKHNRLRLRFVAQDSSQDFTINKLSTTRVKVKNK